MCNEAEGGGGGVRMGVQLCTCESGTGLICLNNSNSGSTDTRHILKMLGTHTTFFTALAFF